MHTSYAQEKSEHWDLSCLLFYFIFHAQFSCCRWVSSYFPKVTSNLSPEGGIQKKAEILVDVHSICHEK